MQLAPARVGPYLRALRAGLHALAPNEDHVPLREAGAHLRALDPALSADVLAPAAVDPTSGMPAFPWMERAVAEQAVARAAAFGDVRDAAGQDWARAARLDADLAARMQARTRLHRFLRDHPLLPTTRLVAALRRRAADWDYSLRYDRMMPGGGWMRLTAELSGPAKWSAGLLHHLPDGGVRVDEGFRHLLARHSVTPIVALQAHLRESLTVQVPRLSRAFLGPFWFPGLTLPESAPEAARNALVLHASVEVLGVDVHTPAHRDPWVPRRVDEGVPAGFGLFRERRFAASPAAVSALGAWARAQGAPTVVVPLQPLAD